MKEQRLKTRSKIKAICDVDEFEDLLGRTILSDNAKEMLRLHYLKGKDFRYIGDLLGYSENTIKRWHRLSLDRLSAVL